METLNLSSFCGFILNLDGSTVPNKRYHFLKQSINIDPQSKKLWLGAVAVSVVFRWAVVLLFGLPGGLVSTRAISVGSSS